MAAQNLFSSKSFPLSNLLEQIRNGDIALPDLQRPFVWRSTQIRNLFDSLFRGYPVGFILLWEIEGGERTRTIGADNPVREPRFLVIDGQQRLTSLYSVLKNEEIVNDKFQKFKPKIAFNPLNGEFEVTNSAIAKDVFWIADITDFFAENSTFTFIREYLEKLKVKHDISEQEERKITSNLERLNQIRSYPFTVLELSPSLDTEMVSEVFVRVNSEGKSLNQSDFVMTVLSVYLPELRENMEKFAFLAKKSPESNQPSPFNTVFIPNADHLIRIIVADAFSRGRLQYAHALLRGRDLETRQESKEIRERNLSKMKESSKRALDLTNWHGFIKILKNIGMVNKSLVSSALTTSFTYALYLYTKQLGANLEELEDFVAGWMYMSVLTSRYIGSPETQFESDLATLKREKNKNYFITTYKRIVASNLTGDFWTINLPEILTSSSSRNHGYLAYLMVLNVEDVKVLFSETRIRDILGANEVYKKSLIERHHLFPVNYLRKQGVKKVQEINQVANYCYIEYPINIEISDEPPAKYFPELLSKGLVADEDYFYHAIPQNFWEMPYQDFLAERRKLMANVIKQGFYKIYGKEQ